MAGNKGPIPGIRVPVALPFAKKDNSNRVVGIKKPVAKFLGFDISELPKYTTANKNAKQGAKTSTTRFKKGTYRGKSFKLFFSKPQSIGGKTVDQISIPLPKGVHVEQAYTYFNNQASKLKLEKMVTPNGRGLPFTKV